MRDFVQVTGGGNCSIAAARDAMGIDWMTKNELNEAIPPAYTRFIGTQLLAYMAAQNRDGASKNGCRREAKIPADDNVTEARIASVAT